MATNSFLGVLGVVYGLLGAIGKGLRELVTGKTTITIHNQINVPTQSSTSKSKEADNKTKNKQDEESIENSGQLVRAQRIDKVVVIVYQGSPNKVKELAQQYQSDVDLGYHSLRYVFDEVPVVARQVEKALSFVQRNIMIEPRETGVDVLEEDAFDAEVVDGSVTTPKEYAEQKLKEKGIRPS